MRIAVPCLTLILFLTTRSIFAHPPTSIELDYDIQEQRLHFVINHVSSNLRKHHIRKVVVKKNGKEKSVLHFPTQTRPRQLIGDLKIQAELDDTLSLKAICSQAGYLEESIIVTEKEIDSQ